MTGAPAKTNGSGPASVPGRRSRIAAALVFMAFCLVWSGAEAQPAPFDLRLFQPEIVTDVVALLMTIAAFSWLYRAKRSAKD